MNRVITRAIQTCAFALPLSAPLSTSAETVFSLHGSPDSFVGMGQNYVVTPNDDFTIVASLEFNNAIVVRICGSAAQVGDCPRSFGRTSNAPVATTPDPTIWWVVALGAGNGTIPTVRRYVDPASPPDFSQPYLSVTGNYRATNQTSGTFIIRELVFASDGTISSLAIDFLEFEENDKDKWDIGHLRINSSVPINAGVASTLLQSAAVD